MKLALIIKGVRCSLPLSQPDAESVHLNNVPRLQTKRKNEEMKAAAEEKRRQAEKQREEAEAKRRQRDEEARQREVKEREDEQKKLQEKNNNEKSGQNRASSPPIPTLRSKTQPPGSIVCNTIISSLHFVYVISRSIKMNFFNITARTKTLQLELPRN